MSTSPLQSELLIANPTLNADPRRYGVQDGPENINRFVQQLRYFLPWVPIDGQLLEIRGHLPSPTAVAADFYDHNNTAPNPLPISSQSPYSFAGVSAQPGPTQQIVIKEITARFDSRVLSQKLLSQQFHQVRFQKEALKHAIHSRMEFGFINGNSTAAPAQFDGLGRLVDRGLGQRLAAAAGAELNILDEAMTLLRTHNRRCDVVVMNQEAWRRVLALQRARGFHPVFRKNRKVRQPVLHINGVPVCLTDHIRTIRTTAQPRVSSVYFLSLGKPNGVFGIVSKRARGIHFTRTSRQDEPFESFQAHLYCALVSTTSDALVEVSGWDVSPLAG